MSKFLKLTAVASLLSGLILASPAKANEPLLVDKDHAKVFRISRPAKTIIIGNPAIFSANVQDLQTIVLTGKTFGSTNLIILDADGEPMIDKQVIVQANETSSVRVYSQGEVNVISCGTNCQ